TYRHSLSASSDPLMSPIFPYTTLFRSPEGYRSFDAVRAELEPRVYIEKKKQLLTERMRDAVARGGDLNAIAQSLGTTVQTAGDDTFDTAVIPGLGREPRFVGTLFGLEQGEISGVTAGGNGVFIVRAGAVEEPAPHT